MKTQQHRHYYRVKTALLSVLMLLLLGACSAKVHYLNKQAKAIMNFGAIALEKPSIVRHFKGYFFGSLLSITNSKGKKIHSTLFAEDLFLMYNHIDLPADTYTITAQCKRGTASEVTTYRYEDIAIKVRANEKITLGCRNVPTGEYHLARSHLFAKKIRRRNVAMQLKVLERKQVIEGIKL